MASKREATFQLPFTKSTSVNPQHFFNFGNIIATEKIDGVNAQIDVRFAPDGAASVTFGNRVGLADGSGSGVFGVGHQDILIRYYNELLLAAEWLMQKDGQDNGDVNANRPQGVAYYGEIYGGFYNGSSNGTLVKVGPQYSPNTEIAIFDVFVNGSWLSWDRVIELCSKFKLPRVPELFRGDVTQFLELFEVETLQSRVASELHNLNAIPPCPAEGAVIRPLDHTEDNCTKRLNLKRSAMCKQSIAFQLHSTAGNNLSSNSFLSYGREDGKEELFDLNPMEEHAETIVKGQAVS